MFQRLDCVCLHTEDLALSLGFLMSMGLKEAWRLDRVLKNGRGWSLVGLDFPDATSSQLVLSTHPDGRLIEVEIRVDDVVSAFAELRTREGVSWIAEPFAIETGHVAVMRARMAMSSY